MTNLGSQQRLHRLVGHLQAPANTKGTVKLFRSPSLAASQYRYIRNENDILSPDQIDQYERDGFIVIKRLFPLQDMDAYRNRFVEIANGGKSTTKTMIVMRDVAIAKTKAVGEHSITKIQDWQDDEILFSYCRHPAILPFIRAIIGDNIRSIHTMLINKPPDLGIGSSRHPPHQDLWYFPIRPAEMIVCSWTAMQHIDQVNGCLFVQPGSHRGELVKHTYPNDGIVNKAYHGIHGYTEEDVKNMLYVEMEAGDTIFFHPLLVHGSGRNNSKGYRKAISCHYASTDCKFINLQGTVQEGNDEEGLEIARKRGLTNITFSDYWRIKSRLVYGKDRPQWAFPQPSA